MNYRELICIVDVPEKRRQERVSFAGSEIRIERGFWLNRRQYKWCIYVPLKGKNLAGRINLKRLELREYCRRQKVKLGR